MTPKEWREEVERALAGSGLPWRVVSAWDEQKGPICCAEVANTSSGKDRTLRLSRTEFATTAERRAEIVRQLGLVQGHGTPRPPSA